ncbi:Uncharacterised protein [Bordetella pertussis]|nr:Uncharacterised protein [Bordetella pertussis]
MQWQVVHAQLMSHACSISMPWASKASEIEVPDGTSSTAPSGARSACGRTVILGISGSRCSIGQRALGQALDVGALARLGVPRIQ